MMILHAERAWILSDEGISKAAGCLAHADIFHLYIILQIHSGKTYLGKPVTRKEEKL